MLYFIHKLFLIKCRQVETDILTRAIASVVLGEQAEMRHIYYAEYVRNILKGAEIYMKMSPWLCQDEVLNKYTYILKPIMIDPTVIDTWFSQIWDLNVALENCKLLRTRISHRMWLNLDLYSELKKHIVILVFRMKIIVTCVSYLVCYLWSMWKMREWIPASSLCKFHWSYITLQMMSL